MTVSEQGLIVPDSGKLALPEYMKPQPGNHPPLDSPGYKSTGLRHPQQPPVLLPLDPIFNSVPDEKARQRLVARFDIELSQPEWALGYEWDIVLRGRDGTVFE